MIALLQLSDLHLLADKTALLKGINPWQSLQRVLLAIRASGVEFDHVVLTGDLTHDGLQQSYEHLAEALGPWADRIWAIPGNHDDRALLKRSFSRPHNGVSLGGGGSGTDSLLTDHVTFSSAAGQWRIIGLDTLVPGELRGEVGERQLAWLSAELNEHLQAPTLIFLHHPPVEVRSAWLDKIGLTDREALTDLIAASPQVKLIGCGHIHQEFAFQLGQASVFAAPATSVQFKPGTDTLEVDDRPPGYRIIRLTGNGFETEVGRAR